MPDISLQGVLRSELQDYLTTQLARYIKHPDVQTTSLVRVAVMGSVTKPGFYQLPADLALADAIMIAGGPTTTADVDRTQVKRGSGCDLFITTSRPGSCERSNARSAQHPTGRSNHDW